MFGCVLRGIVKLKKNPKIREKLGLVRIHPPSPLSIFFLNILKHENNTQKTRKNTTFPKKKNQSWGLTHIPTSEFFSDFWI